MIQTVFWPSPSSFCRPHCLPCGTFLACSRSCVVWPEGTELKDRGEARPPPRLMLKSSPCGCICLPSSLPEMSHVSHMWHILASGTPQTDPSIFLLLSNPSRCLLGQITSTAASPVSLPMEKQSLNHLVSRPLTCKDSPTGLGRGSPLEELCVVPQAPHAFVY